MRDLEKLIVYLAIGGLITLLIGAAIAFSAEIPKDASPIGVQPLSCPGAVVMYDTDGNPANGAEVVAVFRDPNEPPLAVALFGPGSDGHLISVTVGLPDKDDVVYTERDEVVKAYPTFCDVIRAAGDTPFKVKT